MATNACHLLLGALLCAAAARALRVDVSNTQPRLDSAGEILEVHDGNVQRWDARGDFWWYGMSYGACAEQQWGCASTALGSCGFTLEHRILAYTSANLSSGTWQFAGDLLPVATRPSGIYFRPKVFRAPSTGLYVLWVNYLVDGLFSNSQYLVATSDTPEGPFKVVTDNAKTRYGVGGDFDVFVDDDGAAYLVYTSLALDHGVSAERLTDDCLGSMAATDASWSSGLIGSPGNEATAMFKRNGVYYITMGGCCCFCGEGSNIEVFASRSPLGPYKRLGEIARNRDGSSVTKAQQNCVFRVGDQLVWTGDRWQSAPDRVKDHDFQYWTPLVFDDSKELPEIQQLKWRDSFTLDV